MGDGVAEHLLEAKYAAKAARDDRYLHGTAGVAVGDDSPWGEVEAVENIATGLAKVAAGENDGYVLSPERNANIDARWRSISGWYSSETMGAVVVVSSPGVFTDDEIEDAHSILRSYYPDEHDAVVGESPTKYGIRDYQPIQPGESFIRDWNTLWAEKRDTHLQAIEGTSSPDSPDHVVVTLAEPRESYWDTKVTGARKVLVTRSEYRAAALDGGIAVALPRENKYPEIGVGDS